MGQHYILVGCTEGVIRCFSAASLGYVTSLPRPELAQIPDVTAMSYDETHSSLTVVYSDHSLVTWDVGVVTKVSMITSHNFHSSCVWSVDTFQGIRTLLDLAKRYLLHFISPRRVGIWLLPRDKQQ